MYYLKINKMVAPGIMKPEFKYFTDKDLMMQYASWYKENIQDDIYTWLICAGECKLTKYTEIIPLDDDAE